MDNQESRRVTANDVREALEQASQLGVDQKHTSKSGWVQCRKLKVEVRRGYIDEDAYWKLRGVIDRAVDKQPRFDFREHYRPDPTPEEISAGDILPCKTLDDVPVGVYVSEANQGIHTCGRTGAGNTSLLFQFARRLIDNEDEENRIRLPGFIIDKKGREFDSLIRLFPGRVLKATVGRDPFFNPLYSKDASQVIGKNVPIFLYWYERHDSGAVMTETLNLFRQQQKYSRAVAPTFKDIATLVAEIKSPKGVPTRSPALKKSLLTVLDRIITGPLGITTAVQKGWDFHEIIKRGLVLIVDVSALDPTDEQYFVTSLLSEVREIVENSSSIQSICGAKVFFLIDEAMNLVDRKCDTWRLRSPFSQLVTLLRGSEIILMLGYHSPRNVSDIIRSNSYFFISASLTNAGDVLAVKDTAFLSNNQAEALIHLPTGKGMMKMAGRFTHPFLVTWDTIPDYRAVSREEIDENNQRILADLPRIIPEDYGRKAKSATDDASLASESDQAFVLQKVADEPFLDQKERFTAFQLPSGIKLTPDKGKKILEHLQSLGFCESIDIQTGSRGRTSIYWFLTPAGLRLLGRTPGQIRGGTSDAHSYVQNWICKILSERGIQAQMETMIDGRKQVDVGFVCPGTGLHIAVEVCLSTSKTEPYQARKDLDSGWDRVIVVSPTRSQLTQVSKAFAGNIGPDVDPRITLCLPYHLREASSLQEVYDFEGLVFEPE